MRAEVVWGAAEMAGERTMSRGGKRGETWPGTGGLAVSVVSLCPSNFNRACFRKPQARAEQQQWRQAEGKRGSFLTPLSLTVTL